MTGEQNSDAPVASKPRDFNFSVDRCTADIRTLKNLVEQEHWTIEYYAIMPNISLLRRTVNGDHAGSDEKPSPRAGNGLHTLQDSGSKTQIWGCRLCHRFFNYPSLLFDDLFRNHHIKPDAARCGTHIIKLEIKNSDLFRIIPEFPQ